MHLGDTHVLGEINLWNRENLKIVLKNPTGAKTNAGNFRDYGQRQRQCLLSPSSLSLSSLSNPLNRHKGKGKKLISFGHLLKLDNCDDEAGRREEEEEEEKEPDRYLWGGFAKYT